MIEFWLRTRGVQSLGNLQISRWLLIGLRQAQAGPPQRSSEDTGLAYTAIHRRGVILPITFERLKILFRPLPLPGGTGKGPADGPIC